MGPWMQTIMEVVLHWAGSFWILPTLSLFCFIDGFAPILPSETLIIALASLSHTGKTVPLWTIVVAATIGAFLGDMGAYHIGRWLPVHKIPVVRVFATPQRLEKARQALNRRGASYLLAARFIPIGRVAVNMTAGASHYDRRRFIPTMLFADITWTSFSLLIGWVSGRYIGDNPLLAMAIGVVAGIILGTIVDHLIGLYLARTGNANDAAAAGLEPITEEDDEPQGAVPSPRSLPEQSVTASDMADSATH